LSGSNKRRKQTGNIFEQDYDFVMDEEKERKNSLEVEDLM